MLINPRSRAALGFTVFLCAAVSAPAALAGGRCGGALTIDEPTSLNEVARQCNVALSALREANPGVDPSYVSTGARLAIPDEIKPGGALKTSKAPQVAADPSRVVSRQPSGTQINNAADQYAYSTYGAAVSAPNSERFRDLRYNASFDGDDTPAAYSSGGYSATKTMSYQKLSAFRIHNAGVPFSTRLAPNRASLRMDPVACDAGETAGGDKIRQRKISISDACADTSPTNLTVATKGAVYEPQSVAKARAKISRDYNLPDYGRIGATPRTVALNEAFFLRGQVVDNENDCLIMKTENDELWRLSVLGENRNSLLGQSVLVWGSVSPSPLCDGVAVEVSQAIYAEPWFN